MIHHPFRLLYVSRLRLLGHWWIAKTLNVIMTAHFNPGCVFECITSVRSSLIGNIKHPKDWSAHTHKPETHLLAAHLHLEATEHLFPWPQQQHSWNSLPVCVMIMNSPARAVTPWCDCSVSSPRKMSPIHFGVGGERVLWCFMCRTWPRRAGGFVVVWRMLYSCVRSCVRGCLLCIQRPFSKRQNKRQPKQI